MTRIAYIGALDLAATSRHRAEALKRIGCEVIELDPFDSLTRKMGVWSTRFHYHTGYQFLQSKALEWCTQKIDKLKTVDAIWIDSGELFGPLCIRTLKATSAPLILFNHDDPTGPRDGNRFVSLRSAIPHYDLCSVCRTEGETEFRMLGAKEVYRFTRGYDEIEHAPFTDATEIPIEMRSDVAFIGTWMRNEHRDQFIYKLISAGIPVSIWGGRWQKSRMWGDLSPYWKGPALSGRDYVSAIQGAKISLGLLSKGNRDLHTTRSVEIPFAGGLLCAERTSEHLQMYKEDEEAIFWRDELECIEKCKQLLGDDSLRERVRSNGKHRVAQLGVGNEDICRAILERAIK